MLKKLFKTGRAEPAAPRVPEGSCVYAVGDVHGELQLLQRLHGRIQEDASQRSAKRKVVVHLGDYIDRGMSSKQVLDYLSDDPLPGFEMVHLLGNHDQWFRVFLDEPDVGPSWLANGGQATLYSYGVAPRSDLEGPDRLADLHDQLAAAVPERHLAFLDRCQRYHVEGDYAFVHAGIRPGIPLEQQAPDDLMWIREEFLESRANHGVVVVHGHTMVEAPEVLPNRIGIDTGAFATGKMTALVLQGSEQAFLST